VRPDPAIPVETRRLAVAAALRAVREEGDEGSPMQAIVAAVAPVQAEMLGLRSEVRRLAERLERVEDSVELIRDTEARPLSWPVPLTTDSPLEVPPLEVSRKSSPAFDILLGPPPPTAARDSA
jgi:hypothetical protein